MKKDNKKAMKKKRIDSDTAAVLLILFAIVFIAVLFAFLSSGESSVEKLDFSGEGNRPKKEQGSNLEILIGCGFLSTFFIALLAIKIVRDKRRRRREQAIQMEKARKMQELQAARERVQQAKIDAFINAGKEEIERRRQGERVFSNSAGSQNIHRRTYLSEPVSYLDNDVDHEVDVGDEIEYVEEGFFTRIANFFRRIIGID